MKIQIETNIPDNVIKKIKEKIDKNEIKTWKYDNEGDFYYIVEQYAAEYKNNGICVRPSIQNDSLQFLIACHKGKSISRETCGIEFGRFIEMLITHFSDSITKIIIVL